MPCIRPCSLCFLNEIRLKLLRSNRIFAASITLEAVFLTVDVKVNQTNIIDVTLDREFRCKRVRSTGRQLYWKEIEQDGKKDGKEGKRKSRR